ncbi:DUF7919 family protein [Nannocystis punicea]|uniref:DUF7919 domain-containing protein n=1 Tax=Nannocystis punicea TaxID=2995304 RepID=A0ABY7H536_9BACT|nr:hypothetical protein [Nannocystis poenicansa]WAS94403.1 hypothetical protein O0S08_50435 [Nannocystis poenicansa]
MFFADLAPYDHVRELPGVVHVGWLAVGQPFTRGSVTPGVLDKLRLAERDWRVCQTRGFHPCELCGQDEEDCTAEQRWLASAEIWLRGSSGIIYSAPTLIVHYVSEHQYRPPEEFLQAVDAWQPGGDGWDPRAVSERLFEESSRAMRPTPRKRARKARSGERA